MVDARSAIALIGDIHSAWSEHDVSYFNDSAYPLLVVLGDLGGSRARDGLRIARSMAGLTRDALVMPGNNDVHEYASIAAELTYLTGRSALLDELRAVSVRPSGAVAPETSVRTCGYSAHALQLGALNLTLIAARPFAMGGNQVSFSEQLEQHFGVRTMAQSTERLCALVDAAQTEQLVFIAHNGPTGLGADPDDIWGRDFHAQAGDWGDEDLRRTIDYAATTKRVTRAVVAGHMHWRTRDGKSRRWQRRHEGILYINAARVPRIVHEGNRTLHSHIALSVTEDAISAEEVLVESPEPRTAILTERPTASTRD